MEVSCGVTNLHRVFIGLTASFGFIFVGAAACLAEGAERNNVISERTAYVKRALVGRGLPDGLIGRKQKSSGTGFFVNRNHLVTNRHVVADCAAYSVRVGDDRDVTAAKLLAKDPAFDLAVLETEIVIEEAARFPNFANAAVDWDGLNVIGYPELGYQTISPITVSAALDRAWTANTYEAFVFRAKVRRGNSGSPVLDRDGSIVGIVTKKMNPVSMYQTTGRVLEEDIGFAISHVRIERFLATHNVEYHVRRPDDLTSSVIKAAKNYIAQIGCWK
jgi:serine protease Do